MLPEFHLKSLSEILIEKWWDALDVVQKLKEELLVGVLSLQVKD